MQPTKSKQLQVSFMLRWKKREEQVEERWDISLHSVYVQTPTNFVKKSRPYMDREELTTIGLFARDSPLQKVNLDLGFTVDQLHRGSEIHRGSTRKLFAKQQLQIHETEVLVEWLVLPLWWTPHVIDSNRKKERKYSPFPLLPLFLSRASAMVAAHPTARPTRWPFPLPRGRPTMPR